MLAIVVVIISINKVPIRKKMISKGRKLKVLVTFTILFNIVLLIQFTRKTNLPISIMIEPIPNNSLAILYWHKFFNSADFDMGLGTQPFKDCQYNNCYTTSNRNLLPVDQFKALLFHGFDYEEVKFGKPQTRRNDQIYIFYNLESPERTTKFLNLTNGFYNWTMTYRTDSDVFRPYCSFVPGTTKYVLPTIEHIINRPKKIAWFVSNNCHSMKKHEDLYRVIQKYIPVDVYGKCGNFSRDLPIVFEEYKFMFAFEDSDCTDYVSEKMYRALARDAVPIVFGGADYQKLAPPSSVIDVKDFRNVENLIDYLKFLDENPEVYLKYFEWKQHFVTSSSPRNYICELCKKLNSEVRPKTYESITKWWLGKDLEHCSNQFVESFLSGSENDESNTINQMPNNR